METVELIENYFRDSEIVVILKKYYAIDVLDPLCHEKKQPIIREYEQYMEARHGNI